MSCYGLLFEYSEYSTNESPYYFLQYVILMSGALGGASISLWAAHNLSPLGFMTSGTISKLLSISIWINLAGMILAFINIPVELGLYGISASTVTVATGFTMSTVIWTLSSVTLLIFARKQLSARIAGEPIQKSSIAETFS